MQDDVKKEMKMKQEVGTDLTSVHQQVWSVGLCQARRVMRHLNHGRLVGRGRRRLHVGGVGPHGKKSSCRGKCIATTERRAWI